jgi:nucleoside-diphosphate-sugar epimerase
MSLTLVTGADGHIGRALTRWLLEHRDDDLLLFVRAGNDAERNSKAHRLADLAGHPRCTIVYGDLGDEQPFAGITGMDITGIVHCAAATSFSVDRQTASRINVEGTGKLLAFASDCLSLRRFCFISSIYAAGLRTGAIHESPLDDSAQFANHYEWSKWQAEQLLRARQDIPWQIFRVATIICDDETGAVGQQNAVHNTLRLLYYGLLSVIPGDPGTRLYMVSTEFVAEAIGRLFGDGDVHATYHLSDAGEDAVTLAKMTDTIYAGFLADPSFARQRILKPLHCDRESFDLLVSGAAQFGGAISQALDSVSWFAPQLYSDKDVRTQRACDALGGLRASDSVKLLQATCRYLVKTRWGRRPGDTCNGGSQ